MKLSENFIDLVYENKDKKDLKIKLISKLLDHRIAELAHVLLIKTKNCIYAVKIRWCEHDDENNIVDIQKIHDRIYKINFITISKKDYLGLNSREEIYKRTHMLLNNYGKMLNCSKNILYDISNLSENDL